jgi:peptidoglycan/LPS O-acetylase OafA/YrhL
MDFAASKSVLPEPEEKHETHDSSSAHLVSPTSKPELKALTGLRFFAAGGVVLYHFAQIPLPAWARPVQNIIGAGYIAVNFFYLLSGFILTYSYISTTNTFRGTRRRFYVSRFARIYPAYFLGFLLAAPTDILVSFHTNRPAVAAVKLTVGALLLLSLQQAWTPWTAWVWNYPAWSISVEAFFYLIFPWLGPRLSRIRSSRYLFTIFALWLLSLLTPLWLVLTKGTTGAPQLGDHLQIAIECTPLLRLPDFAIGILLGRAFTSGRFVRLRGAFLSSAAALAILFLVAFFPTIPYPLLAGGLLTPFFCILIVAVARGDDRLGRFLSLPAIVFLGEASYGIYILQIPVAYVLRVPPPLSSPTVLVLFCVALTTTAVLSFRLVESPLRARIKTWLG